VGFGGFVKNTVLGKGVDDFGAIPVPGSGQFDLPAGKVRLTYQESKKSKSDDATIYFSVPATVQITVTPAAGGAPLELAGPGFKGMGSNRSTKRGRSRDEVGKVEVTSPGPHKVEATGDPGADAVEPQLLIGR
jgi:hypothetical protein